MPEVVLRNSALPDQPAIVDVAVGGYVPDWFKDSGWEIDSKTSADDARSELAALAEKTAKANEDLLAAFVPEFAPETETNADVAPAAPAVTPAPTPPTPPADPETSGQAAASLTLPEGN